jgi:propionyl-CoA:succinyl-CoA transferase
MSQLPFPVLTADEAAALIDDRNTIGFGGFTPAGSAKAIPRALALRAEVEHAAGRPFKVRVLSGASTGKSVDGALATADAISFRAPYQANSILRKKINAGEVHFVDMHLSMLPQQVRYGFFGPIDVAIVEAVDVTPAGGIVLSAGVGAANTYLRMAKKILIEVNAHHPQGLLGMHDIFEPEDPPTRTDLHIDCPSDRVGSPICVVDPQKIAGLVMTNEPDETGAFSPADAVTEQIAQNVIEFLIDEMKVGRIPASFLPLQSGVGNIANAVLGALGRNPAIPAFEMYTEVLQDSTIPLIEAGRLKFASTTALALSPEASGYVYNNLGTFRNRILLRPQEISNNPEIARRLGIISMNTAIEVDLGGAVNSSHIMGRQLMNGIGGSGDFTRNAYLSIFSCPSTQKNGKVSTVVPVVSHMDHSEHSVDVLVTEHGVADLRGKDPRERGRIVIANCAAPEYRDQLSAYLAFTRPGHEAISFRSSFEMHHKFAQDGDMRGVIWTH